MERVLNQYFVGSDSDVAFVIYFLVVCVICWNSWADEPPLYSKSKLVDSSLSAMLVFYCFVYCIVSRFWRNKTNSSRVAENDSPVKESQRVEAKSNSKQFQQRGIAVRKSAARNELRKLRRRWKKIIKCRVDSGQTRLFVWVESKHRCLAKATAFSPLKYFVQRSVSLSSSRPFFQKS